MSSEFKVLSDRAHILLRPSMYIGSVSPELVNRYIDGKHVQVSIVQGLSKIINELIDNSIDEFLRSGKKFANKISIIANPKSFRIEDNGRGIPVEKYENTWRPELCWTACRAGTSFSDDRVGAGANGLGSVAANIFSKKFLGETADGQRVCTVLCQDNAEKVNTSVSIKKTNKTGTSVYIEPDFQRFSCTEFSEDQITLIRERLLGIASIYPEISFTFNGESIRCRKPKEYLSIFGETFIAHEDQNFFIGIFPTSTDEYCQKSMLDGLEFFNGGSHEEYVSRSLSNELKVLIKKKHKLEMSPAEIKRGLFLVINGKHFQNMKFDSQTKERLTNTESEVKKYFGEIPFEKLAKQILATDDIILPIIETKLAKQAAIDARAVTMAQKKLSANKVDKHLKALSRNPDERILFLCEGDSAAGALKVVRDIQKHGGFPLRGVPMNCYGSTHKQILENKEFKNIMAILGLQFNKSKIETLDNLEYGTVGIMTDADVDGSHILTLLVNFFYNWPELFANGIIKYVRTPRWICTKNKDVQYFYTDEDFEQKRNSLKGYEIRYIKGLGSLRTHEYTFAINNQSMWQTITIDDVSAIRTMFAGDAVSERKEILKNG